MISLPSRRCGYVDNSPLRSEFPTYPQRRRLRRSLPKPKRGHLYFVNLGTFLLWLDIVLYEGVEIYVGINKRGTHFVIPCQAKSPGDRFGIVQVMQDTSLCEKRYPHAICKPIALQFTNDDGVAILELAVVDQDELLHLNIVEEKHYQLVPRTHITNDELRAMVESEL